VSKAARDWIFKFRNFTQATPPPSIVGLVTKVGCKAPGKGQFGPCPSGLRSLGNPAQTGIPKRKGVCKLLF
jgi:hypothetical protein